MGRWVCDSKDVGGSAAVRQRGESGVRRGGLGLGLVTATPRAGAGNADGFGFGVE